jgi:hypothetical protein
LAMGGVGTVAVLAIDIKDKSVPEMVNTVGRINSARTQRPKL